MLGQDSEDEIWSRFVFELMIWTQPSGPLCLWHCFATAVLTLRLLCQNDFFEDRKKKNETIIETPKITICPSLESKLFWWDFGRPNCRQIMKSQLNALVPPFGPIVNVNGAKDFNDFETKNCKIKVDATPTQKPHHFDNLYVEFNPPVFQHHSHVRPSEQLVFILTKMIVVTVFYNAKWSVLVNS